jgi:tyrosinase
VQSLSPNDPWFTKYAQAIQAMHQLQQQNPNDPRNWRNQSLIHITHCPHGADDFVHWHRYYINNYEAILGQLIGDPTFALAYWNWSAKNGIIPDPFYDVNQCNVTFWNDPSNAQSNNWSPFPVNTIGTRGLSKGQGLQSDPNSGQVFTQSFIDGILAQTDFDIFTGTLEGSPHNNGHVISGRPNGHMINGMSPLDPIFWLHHCNIDRIWAEWQTAGNTTPPLSLNYNNQFVNGTGQPVMASSANALNFAAMGYTYDTIAGPIAVADAQQLGLQPPGDAPGGGAPPGGTPVQPTQPQTVATADSGKTAVPNVETRIPVDVKDLTSYLFKPRIYRATKVPSVQRAAVEGGRIIAKLTQITPPQKDGALICKVFVDCPYLSPSTPSTDPHFASSFSFFGRMKDHAHGAFYVDLTQPLRNLYGQGRVTADKVNVQLMPVGAGPDIPTPPDLAFKVGKIEILAV